MEVTTTASQNPGFLDFIFSIISFILTVSFIGILLIFSLIILYWLIPKLTFHGFLKTALKKGKVFLLIKIPAKNEQKEDAMEAFLASLHRLLPTGSTFSLEIASTNQFLSFYIVVPKVYKSVLESQLYSQYPTAEIEEQKDYLPTLGTNFAFEELHFKTSSTHALSTYKEIKEDVLKNLSALLSQSDPGDQAFMQIVLKKVGNKLWHRGFNAGIAKLSNTPNSKLSQDLFMGKARLIVISHDQKTAKNKLNTLISVFKAVKSARTDLRKKKFHIIKTPIAAFYARVFEKGDLFTPAEIATIYHFPYSGSIVSNVVQSTSKRAPAPDILPYYGIVDPQDVSFFGETNYRSEQRVFGIKDIDRRRHLYVVGKTGSGKSRLLELLLISDIQKGHGCCLLDPHGDLADELLMYVPKNRIEDVIYVNPTDKDFPIGFNPLEPVSDYQMRQHLSTFFIAIFKKLFAATWNPRMEHIIRYITLALLETPDSNILGIQRMLSDTTFRQRVIKQIQDPVVKSFWTTEFSSWNERFANDAVIPILNKIGQFIANPIVRNMVGQRQNVLDFEKFMNEGKIVIINLSKGKLGDDNAALLGSMFITKIQQAALARAKFKEEERKDFFFYVDEFQNFATEAFSSILSEARKYHLDLTIAHQYIAQLPEDVKATAFGNVGSIISFAVGGDDANYLAKEFAPVFSAEDMINLNTREMYVRMSVDGKLTQPFSARTIDVPKPTTDYSTEIIGHSRMKYGQNKVVVENEIAKWSQSVEYTEESIGKNEFPEPII